MAQQVNNGNFRVPYLTPKGQLIQLEVPDLPDDAQLRDQLADIDNRPQWAQAYLDDVYAEYRQWDNRRRSDISADAVGDEGADHFEDDQPYVADTVESGFTVELLLGALPERKREVLELHVLRGDRFTEIAADLTAAGRKISADGVRKLCRRALDELRQRIEQDPDRYL
ncbi:RNA polymerase sigma factor [Propionimicrobium lymphophilum]|uniref:RNA polymerase sigma factor n=1 Tax=Propionimicrobium lymphophilum TaxID=33012 RepID=UPI0023F55849|nr:hypothetical protein [Propionimicrobium lymphophilum]